MNRNRGVKILIGSSLGAILLVVVGLFSFSGEKVETQNNNDAIVTKEQSAQIPQDQLEFMNVEVVEAENKEISVAIPVKVEVSLKKPKEILKLSNAGLNEVDGYLVSERGEGLFGVSEEGRNLSGEGPKLGKKPTELEIESHDFARREFKTEW